MNKSEQREVNKLQQWHASLEPQHAENIRRKNTP
jgi:hypothetical protein